MKKALWSALSVLAVIAVLGVVVVFYPYIFDKNVYGEMLSVERVGPQALVTSDKSMAFSFAIAIKDKKSGIIYTASSEDRQWGAWEKLSANKGVYCVEARLYPYPPWNIEKADTYHDARLIKVSEGCK